METFRHDMLYALAKGDLPGCSVDGFVLRNRYNLDDTDECGWTPLIMACETRNEHFARLLINAGADVHKKTYNSNRPLHIAAKTGAHTIVKMLLDAGADPYARNGYPGSFTDRSMGYCGKGNTPLDECTNTKAVRNNRDHQKAADILRAHHLGLTREPEPKPSPEAMFCGSWGIGCCCRCQCSRQCCCARARGACENKIYQLVIDGPDRKNRQRWTFWATCNRHAIEQVDYQIKYHTRQFNSTDELWLYQSRNIAQDILVCHKRSLSPN